jgi:hypothetical protein
MAYGNFKKKKSSPKARALKYGYRSGLEEKVAVELKEHYGYEIPFETLTVNFEQPAKMRRYTPDFLLPNGIIIETKGRLTVKDRKKHLWIQEQFPELDLRFVFSNPKNKIYKGSKTSYGDWCEQYGFKYAKKSVPQEWLDEDPVRKPLAINGIEVK